MARKNPTPQTIAFFVSLFITAMVVAGLFLFFWLSNFSSRWAMLGLFALFVFGTTYFTTTYYLQRYIYRKIKVIYKTIHNQKVSPEEKNKSVDLNQNIIEEVEKEVEEWANSQMLEIQKYKSWAEYRRKFVGDISHELKTPIFNIQGYVHTLLDGALQEEGINISFLRKAAKNVERLHTIVEDLEAISRMESGELILELQPFDVRELAQDIFEELEIKAEHKKIKLQLKEGADQSFMVKADRDSIRQVLINLVDNSLKYGKEGGLTKIGFYDMDKNILIEVADNGIGIPKKHLNHVFDRFYRVDKSRSRAQGGSGLGLSIVKHIIEAHKQTINVRSTPNLGSTFGFTLEKAR